MKKLLYLSISLLMVNCSLIAQEKFTINFDFGKYDITALAKSRLDSFLNAVPTSSILFIWLDGHCDFIGNDANNDKLSVNRVNATKDYIISKGISASVFRTEGHGKRMPLNQNATEAQRYLNRRVELRIERKIEEPQQQPPQQAPDVKETPAPKNEESLTKQITDTATKEGSNIILRNMNFIGGRHVLLPGSVPILEELLQVLKDNPKVEIEIQGHICCTQGSEDGMDIDLRTPNLSVMRAKAIYEYLVGHGIHKKRLSYRGFGHQYPLVYPEDTEEKRTTNRRVEIKIIKK